MTDRPAPGERRPRTLERPPGERYRPVAVPQPVAERPSSGRAAVFAGMAAVATAIVFAALGGALDLTLGLLVVAAVGGWSIGWATRWGAWSGQAHRSRGSVRAIAIVAALGAWLGGEFGAYLLSLALRPESSLSFGDRIAAQSFLDWLSPQFGPLEIMQLFLLGGIAWYASR